MQVAFLKDLVTPREPLSRFSFISYLHKQERLADFINHRILYPTRIEFHNYLEWAAACFGDDIHYGAEVLHVGTCRCLDKSHFEVRVRQNGKVSAYHAANVVLALGVAPDLPTSVAISERVWHNSELLSRLEMLPAEPSGVAIVGGGQSAAETTAYVHEKYRSAAVHAIYRRYGYSIFDDSPFVNMLFDPDTVDSFYSMSHDLKKQIRRDYQNTNYSVVELDLIENLYRRVYNETTSGRRRLFMHNLSAVTNMQPTGAGLVIEATSVVTGKTQKLPVDMIIYATGYKAVTAESVVSSELIDERDADSIGRDYRLCRTMKPGKAIYVQGPATEKSHGISASLLSVSAVRAGEIVKSIADGICAYAHEDVKPAAGAQTRTGKRWSQ